MLAGHLPRQPSLWRVPCGGAQRRTVQNCGWCDRCTAAPLRQWYLVALSCNASSHPSGSCVGEYYYTTHVAWSPLVRSVIPPTFRLLFQVLPVVTPHRPPAAIIIDTDTASALPAGAGHDFTPLVTDLPGDLDSIHALLQAATELTRALMRVPASLFPRLPFAVVQPSPRMLSPCLLLRRPSLTLNSSAGSPHHEHVSAFADGPVGPLM